MGSVQSLLLKGAAGIEMPRQLKPRTFLKFCSQYERIIADISHADRKNNENLLYFSAGRTV